MEIDRFRDEYIKAVGMQLAGNGLAPNDKFEVCLSLLRDFVNNIKSNGMDIVKVK